MLGTSQRVCAFIRDGVNSWYLSCCWLRLFWNTKLSVTSGNFGVGELGDGVSESSASSGTVASSTDASAAAQETDIPSTKVLTTESPAAATDSPNQGSAATEDAQITTETSTDTDCPGQSTLPLAPSGNLKCVPQKRQ